MPRLKFEAWVNGLNSMDPGHMGMLDERGGYYYEFAIDTEVNTPPDQQQKGRTPNRADRTHVATSVTVRDAMSGQPRTTQTRPLILYRQPKADYFRRQLMKMVQGTTTFRFTHMFYIEVDVTEIEYRWVMIQAFVRGSGGTYNMMKEAQVKHPLATRCLSLLEDLASFRQQKLPAGTALDLLISFQQLNPHLQIKNDPLIAI